MTPAEFKSALRRLGLTQGEAAAIFGYAKDTSIRRMGMPAWRSNHREISVPLVVALRYMLRDLEEGRWTGRPDFQPHRKRCDGTVVHASHQ